MGTPFILAIDQGTTGSRVFCMDQNGQELAITYREHQQIYPKPGWVEHDAMEIWHNVSELIPETLDKGGLNGQDCQAIGITNQRETIVAWNKETGEPVHNAIVWQCRRTAPHIRQLQEQKLGPTFQQKNGLILDPYFSGTKITWLLDNVPEAKKLADQGKLLVGTMETWLIWKMTKGQAHKSDFTNASRTLLFNLEKKDWDDELAEILRVPRHILPEPVPSSHHFGDTQGVNGLPDGVPIHGAAGDQQAALFGQACVEPGQAKNTYGTGCFLLMNTGDELIRSENGLLTTLGCNAKGEPAYVLEGAIFIAGATLQWLRDSLKLIESAPESEELAFEAQQKDHNVVLVPSFVGLGAPHWLMDTRAAIYGLTLDTGKAEIAQAALHSIALQSRDLVEIMEKEGGLTMDYLRADGGACNNNYLMQYQADIINKPVHLPRNLETTVLGAALLAGIGTSFYDWQKITEYNPYERQFSPQMDEPMRNKHIKNWNMALKSTMAYKPD